MDKAIDRLETGLLAANVAEMTSTQLRPFPPTATASAAAREPSLAASVSDAATRYAEALEALEASASGNAAAEASVDVALARDAVAHALRQCPAASAAELQQLAVLDERLRAHAKRPECAVGSDAVVKLRDVLQPPEQYWWWALDSLATAAPHPLWPVVAGACITLAVSLATDVSLRFLSGGPDLLGLLGTFAQALLALLAGSAFTRVGGEKTESLLTRLGLPRARHPAWKALLSALLLLTVVALWSAMPAMARLYNDHGVRLLECGEASAAADAFERALRLSTQYPQARYNLAVAREDLLDYDQAIVDYQRAIRLDERLYAAYNNLAHLYLLRKNDGGSALALAERGLALKPTQAEVRYSLLKNRGWALLLLGHLLQAEEALREAITLRPQDSAAAHCLLAQVLEKRRPASAEGQQAAGAAWAQCAALAPGTASKARGDDVEPAWLSLAEERLRGATP